jgi:ribosomal protein S18 acetylase RimI-like enzyme
VSVAEYRIRYASASEMPLLSKIEQSASELFADTRHAIVAEAECLKDEFILGCIACNSFWVAVDENNGPVGFAAMAVEGGNAHLHELSVAMTHMRRGIGSKLVETVVDAARERGFPRLTLSTFEDVEWNAPFYRRLGFRVLDPSEYHDDLRRLRSVECQAGLDIDSRIMMCLELN